MSEKLALFGGSKAIKTASGDMFKWPIITSEDEKAVLDVLHNGAMSGTDITRKFEQEFAQWQGTKYALGFNNGTASLHAAMFGCKIGVGDEVICPGVTYWASAMPVYSLGATIVFADIDPETLCIDVNDIEHKIGDKTKAILVVHYLAFPANMDRIMEIAKKHHLKVIEDVSHAQGGYYKGKKLGCIGDVGAMSLMTEKSFAIGEAGMLVTNDQEIYERAIAFGHYDRFENMKTESLRPYECLPMGGYKYRMHQMSSAVGRVQLKYYDERCREIDKAMNYFWDLLEGTPGIRAHRVPKNSGCTMAGWYSPRGAYVSEELGGLSISRFTEAIRAEGFEECYAGINKALYMHPLFQTCDIYGHGKPTRIANADRDVRLRENKGHHIHRAVVQALPPRNHRRVCQSVQEGRGELQGASEGRQRRSGRLGGLALFQAYLRI